MGRSQIFEGIWETVRTNVPLLTLLGTQTPTNRRLYRSFAQLQTFLLGPPRYEPQTDEGWLVIEEVPPGIGQAQAQYESVFEILEINVHIFATTYGLGDDVADVLDSLWGWTVEQQREVQYGNYLLVFARAFQTGETYAQAVTLPQKTRQYRFRFVLAEQVA